MKAFVTFHRLTAAPLHRLAEGTAGFAAAALLVLGTTMAPMASAQLSERNTGLDNSGDPKSELAACKSGHAVQGRATCMNEVRRAQAAKRAGKLENYGDFAANALKRCEVFKTAEDLEACRARVERPKIDGSVAAGGILREAEIVVTAPASSTTPGTSTTPDTPVTPAPGSNTTPASPMAPGSTMSPGSSQTMPETTPPPAAR